jgi:hypothetical protein
MNRKQNVLIVFLCSFLFLFTSTFLISEPYIASAATTSSVTLNISTSYLVKGETTKLKVTGTSKKVTWTSTNKKIVTVSSSGKVIAVGHGSAYINATVNNKAYKCKVIVINPAEITFEPSDTMVVMNGTGVSLNPVSDTYSAAVIKKAGITYKVNGNSGVKVSSTGKVTSTKAGEFSISAYVHGKKIKTIAMKAIAYEGFSVPDITLETGSEESKYISFAGDIKPIREDVKVSISNSTLVKVKLSYDIDSNSNVGRYNGIYVRGMKDGTCIITVTISGVAKELKVILGDGLEKLPPLDAVKNNDFTGYTGKALTTLTEIRRFIDENNLLSTTLTDREKITIIQNYLTETKDRDIYDTTRTGLVARVFFNGTGLCAAYAETVCFLSECIGIEVLYCVGEADNGDGTGFGGHGWNKVKVDGTWYYIDAMWNASLKSSKYFLSETLWPDHILHTEEYNIVYVNEGEVPYMNVIY